jgi:hypothetical protein
MEFSLGTPGVGEEDEKLFMTDQAASHIDAFVEYDMLVGESDGGVALSEKAYNALKKKADAANADRLFVTWRHLPTGMDCVNVGPSSR